MRYIIILVLGATIGILVMAILQAGACEDCFMFKMHDSNKKEDDV